MARRIGLVTSLWMVIINLVACGEGASSSLMASSALDAADEDFDIELSPEMVSHPGDLLAPTQQFWGGGSYDSHAVRIPVDGGIELAASLFVPRQAKFPGPRPTIIFANSWSMNEYEYEIQARKFANKGYLVLNYSARGWGLSGGEVNVGGPLDMADIHRIVDWLVQRSDCDQSKIAISGISYGGGLALVAAAHEPRIKTVVAISSWGDLYQSLYGNNTMRRAWIDLLMLSGKITGRLSPEIGRHVESIRRNENLMEVYHWALERSPVTYLSELNRRKVPVFVANSYQDQLFPPAQMRRFYEALTGPKRFYMDRGIHASSAIPGLFGLPSAVWNDVHGWMDHWLKDEKTSDVMSRPSVTFQAPGGREDYAEIPKAEPGVLESRDLDLSPINQLTDLSELESTDTEELGLALTGGDDTAATSGIPVLSDLIDAYLHKPPTVKLHKINKNQAALFISPSVPEGGKLRGAPRVKVPIAAHKTSVQMVTYLYDVDEGGYKGSLVSHGVFTVLGAGKAGLVTMDLAMTAYDLPKGHSLLLVIDTRDPLYESPVKQSYKLGILHRERVKTELRLPWAN